MDMQLQHADTVPGFTMQSEGFYLKFVTGLQCGVSSRLLEYETDWYEVMEILLSRLQDEPEHKERFETIASRDLEYWARIQPGGDTLNLKIRVSLEEKRYHLPPNGTRKNLRLIFNDRFSTEVIFYARKKMLLKSLKDLAAVSVADHFNTETSIGKLHGEIPKSLIPDVIKAFNNCWTARFWRTKIVPCPYWCICKAKKKSPLALSEIKLKTPNPRRQLTYKKVAEKHVRPTQKKKIVKKNAQSKKSVQVPNKKGNKSNKKSEHEIRFNKNANQGDKKTSKKKPVSKATDSAKKKPVRQELKKTTGTSKNNTIGDARKNVSKGKSSAGKNQKTTPSVKKVDLKKNSNNLKALKDKVKAMKNKLKALMETVAVKKRTVSKSDPKKSSTMSQKSPKRNASKRNAPLTTAVNPEKKVKIATKNKPNNRTKSKEEIFSPRPTRSVKSVVKSNGSESKGKKNAGMKSKFKKRDSSESDNKFTKSSPTDAKFTKVSKQKLKVLRQSPRNMPRNKSKGTKPDVKIQKPKSLKRSLRSQVQEVPTKKRRQG